MPIEAMVDLTGGLAERYELKNAQMYKTVYKYLRKLSGIATTQLTTQNN